MELSVLCGVVSCYSRQTVVKDCVVIGLVVLWRTVEAFRSGKCLAERTWVLVLLNIMLFPNNAGDALCIDCGMTDFVGR